MKRSEATAIPDTFTLLKDRIHFILNSLASLPEGRAVRLFALVDDATNDFDTTLFARGLRYDLACYTIVCDVYVLPLFTQLTDALLPWFTVYFVNSELTCNRTYAGENATNRDMCISCWFLRP